MEELFMQVFDRRDWVEAQMRQQVDSYAQSLAFSLLAAGRRPPPWLLPSAIGVPQGNMLRGPLRDLSNLKITDGVCNPPPDTHLLVEPKMLEFDGVKLGSLNTASCSEIISQHQKCVSEITLEFTGMHSLNHVPSTKSLEGSHPMISPLLGKNTLHSVETNFLEEPHSMSSPRLEKETMHSAETNFLEGPHSMANQFLGKDELLTINQIQRSIKSGKFSDRSTNGSAMILEQQNSECHTQPPTCDESPLQIARLAGTSSGAAALLGMPLENLLEDGCERSSHSQLHGATSRYFLARSTANPEPFLLQSINDGDVYQHSLASSSTQTDGDSNGGTIAYAFESTENGLSQVQYLLPKPSLEFATNGASVDCPMECPALVTSNESLQKKPVLDFVNCHPEQLSDAQINFSVPTKAHNVSVGCSKGESAMHTAERNSMASADKCIRTLQHDGTEQKICCFNKVVEINTNSCTKESDEQTKSPRSSVQYFVHSSGSSEKVTPLKPDGKSSASEQNSSIANEVQLNGNSPSERKTINNQSDIVFFSPSTRNASSMDFQVDIGGQMDTRQDLLGDPQPSVRYLRSSGSHGCISLNSEERTASRNQKSVAHEVHASGNSSPKRSMAILSDDICCNSPRMKILLCTHHGSGSSSGETVAEVPQYSQSNSLENNFDAVTTSFPSCSDVLSDGEEHCNKKGNPCFKYPEVLVDGKTLTVEHQELAQMDDVASGSVTLSPDNDPGSTLPTTFLNYVDQQCQQACTWNASIQEKLSYSYSIKFDEEGTNDDPKGQPVFYPDSDSGTTSSTTFPSSVDHQCEQVYAGNVSIQEKLSYGSTVEHDEKGTDDDPKGELVTDAAIPWPKDDDSSYCNETVPKLERFSIPVTSNSPTIEERAFEDRDSTKLANLSSSLSMKYKINKLSDVYQSLASRFEKLMNHSSLNADETKRHIASYDTNKLGISGAYGLELDGSFSDVLTYGSSNDSNIQESSEIPLTPSVEKYSLGKLSERIGSSSEHLDSIPEIVCFQIDEDSIVAEENENQDKSPGSAHGNSSNQCLTERKAFQDVTGLYQTQEKSVSISTRFMDGGRLSLKTAEAYSSEIHHHSNLRIDHASKEPKESHAPSIRRQGDVLQSHHDRLSRTEMQGNKNVTHKSAVNLEKDCKPRIIVANVTSFVQLVKQKKQSTTTCVKRDVRVKALEVAEAAKRLEEKKQNEREISKAAAKLERERLKQEKQKQKQEEQKKKRNVDISARKRHRGDKEKKEKERKRKCIEEARKQQKQLVERIPATNSKKDAREQHSDYKELGKNLVGGVKSQFRSDEKMEYVLRYESTESNNLKGVVAGERAETSSLQVQEYKSNNVDKSYEMSPYKDSDEEDDDDVEHEEELRHTRKIIPSWAQRENLDKILLSNQTLDPREIFARKCSFNLSNVLAPQIPRRRF